MKITKEQLAAIIKEEVYNFLRENESKELNEQWPYIKASREEALEEAGTAPDGGSRVAGARKKCTDQGKRWDAKEVSKPGGLKRACKDK